ncbi:hypothetical protein [Pelomicrobium methylotrophicum]|uniref:Uncharacterized protein n=1 Tax=Pelomicrobium methylotrophicum TaxID=2602750 RepID=A0A5C7ETU2_9PROT|nr:hypothetical protein [Pelomicrobium methylotrophicum]TXF11604.1 hypothetical protein FR698_09700 [Pelomicrobium methylotrophicum]
MEEKNRKTLTEAIARAGIRSQARRLFSLYPYLEIWSARFCAWITELLPGKHGPLVDECLREAVERARDAEASGRDVHAAYCEGLIAHAHLAVAKTVCAIWDHGSEGWDPFVESLTGFLARHEGRKIEILDEPAHEIPDHVARLTLAARVLPAWLLQDVVRDFIRHETIETAQP